MFAVDATRPFAYLTDIRQIIHCCRFKLLNYISPYKSPLSSSALFENRFCARLGAFLCFGFSPNSPQFCSSREFKIGVQLLPYLFFILRESLANPSRTLIYFYDDSPFKSRSVSLSINFLQYLTFELRRCFHKVRFLIIQIDFNASD